MLFSKKTKQTLIKSFLPIFAATMLLAGVVYAWTEPASAPPSPGNISTPINDGITGQVKQGGLSLNYSSSPAAYGLIVKNGLVAIGTDTVSGSGVKLEVQGGAIKATNGFIVETRSSDPSSPAVVQMWLIQ